MFSVASYLDDLTNVIDYCSIPKDWIFSSNGKLYFHYPPPCVQGKALLRMVKEGAKVSKGWKQFLVRKIHHENIGKFPI